MYGCGLRLLECCRLRVKDIDFARLRDHGADGKGIKDRVTMLPARVAASVNATAIIYMESVVQRAFKDALQASGIAKRATCHTLRHYAGSWIMPGGIADRLGMGGSLAA
jgi:integrase